MNTKLNFLTATGLMLVAAGCNNGTGPEGAVTMSFIGSAAGTSVSMSRMGPSFSRVGSAAPLTDSQGNVLSITSAQVVLREIELERVEVADCDVEPEPDGCEEFEVGPILLDLPLDGSTEQQLGINAPPGDYDEVEFEIHKISSSDEEDAAFRAANPDFAGISIRVRGTYNGTAFTYESDLEAEQEFDLSPPLTVADDGTSTNVTVRLDLNVWFRQANGDLIDPATANTGGVAEGIVKENIKQSVEAFEDDDRDGEDDDES